MRIRATARRAWPGLPDGGLQWSPTYARRGPLIRSEAQQALNLSPSEPGPHFLLASIAAVHDYDWNEAASRFAPPWRTRPRRLISTGRMQSFYTAPCPFP